MLLNLVYFLALAILWPWLAWRAIRTGRYRRELAAKFLEWKKRDVTERTIADYRRDYANWIKPTFGHLAADRINEGDVQDWVDDMAKRLAPSSVADRHMLLHSIYKYGRARSRRLVDHNPCEETEMPKVGKKRARGTKISEWRRILDVNLTGGFHGCKAASAVMVPRGRGRIISIGSVAGGHGGADGLSYAASKAGIEGMTRRLAVDVGGYRQRRVEALRRFSLQVAEQVTETGLPKALEPMAAADRKVVHDALNEVDGVRTASEGEEPYRRVVILPAEEA